MRFCLSTTWMDLQGTTLSEKCQVPYDFNYVWNLKKTTNRNGFINIQNKLAIVSWEEGREMGKWEVKGIKLHTSSYKVSHRAEKYNIGNIRKKNAVCSLGFWIFTVESGSGCGLCTTWVHTCSVKIWKTKNLNFIEKII